MDNRFKGYFKFNKTERNGFLIIGIIFLVFLIIKGLLVTFKSTTAQQNTKELAKIINDKIAKNGIKDSVEVITLDQYQKREDRSETPSTLAPLHLHPFDPNTVTPEELLSMGLRPKLVKTIINYRAKGGHFREVESISKIYGIRETEYNSLLPIILIPQESSKGFQDKPHERASGTSYSSSSNPSIKYDLNTADSTQLESLKGIGPSFATRIIKYRNGLGGFINQNQLMEVFGMDSSLYKLICNQTKLDASKIIQIHINSVSEDQLKQHPYLRWKNAKAIINYRNQHGLFKSKQELNNVILLSDETIKKIYPYISID
jgi:DNA uptake protein ComE-like DNA-binding protein